MLVNSPAGWMTEPRIVQPDWGGVSNPGNHWLGQDGWGLLNPMQSLAAASRALELIAGSIAALPWRVQRNETEPLPTPRWIEDPGMSRADLRVTSPVPRAFAISPVAFREQVVTSLLLRGNCYLFVAQRGPDGAPIPPLMVLNPDDVEIREGRYFAGGEPLDDSQIIHISGKAPLDHYGRGLGVLEQHAASLGLLSAAVSKATSAVVAPVPAGIIEVGSGWTVSPEETAQLREDWESLHSGKYGIGVLNSTLSFKPLAWSPEALQLIQLADFGVREVALAFGISPSWLGVPDSSLTYNTVQLKAIELRQFSLLPWVRRIEAAYDAELPRGQELSIVLDGLERADTGSRYGSYEVGIRSGFLTADEARRLEGWQPLEQEAPSE